MKDSEEYVWSRADIHTFTLIDGKWWCDWENVISEECTDENRCTSQCFCNDKEDYDA